MEDGFFLIIGLLFLAAPIMAIVALVQIGKLKTEVANLRRAIVIMRARQEEAAAPAAEAPAPAAAATVEAPATAEASEIHAEVREEPEPAAETPTQAEPEGVVPDAAWTPEATPREEKKSTSWLEEALAFRWLVWLGGATLALGGIFFVQYSMERGLISPLVRIALAMGLGGILVFAGEWFRRRPLRKAIAALRPDYIPSAITAAGVAILYGSTYAGYALYDMFAPLLAFAFLAAISVLALGLSLVQGPLIAALGVVGAYVVPLLIGSDEPSYWSLFSYLTIVGAAVLAIVHTRHWWWAACCVIAGSGLWSAMAMPFADGLEDLIPLAVFILLAFIGQLSLLKTLPLIPENQKWLRPALVVFVASCVTALLLFALGLREENGVLSLAAMAVFTGVTIFAAWSTPAVERMAPVPAVMGLVVLVCWALPGEVYPLGFDAIGVFGRLPVGGPMDDLGTFLASAVLFAVFFGGVGHLALTHVRHKGLWALLSAAVPVLTLAIVYYRCDALMVDLGWAALGLLLAAMAVGLATRLHRHPQARALEIGVGLYAVATIGAISLAATMTLSEVWLSVALAVQLPALAWVNGHIRLPYGRHVALVVGSIVFVRLILLHTFFGTTFDVPATTAWIFYGYGIPAVAYYLAARWFHQERDSITVHFLESFAVAAAVLTVSLEIRYWVNGALMVERYGLLEQSLQSASWLASALGFYVRYKRMPRPVSYWGARILGLMAVVQIVVLQLVFNNPLFTGEEIGDWPVVNILLVAYGVPAAFAAAFAWQGWKDRRPWLLWGAGGAALAFSFLNVTLEIRHWFQGAGIRFGVVEDAELYTYSAGWLVFAGLLMLAGFWRHLPVLRKAALGIVLLTVVKVFVLDMAGLTGLYRVASFMGLGASLLLVGFLYQRFVLVPEQAKAD